MMNVESILLARGAARRHGIAGAQSESKLGLELRSHLEQQVADYAAAGMTEEEARRRAQIKFGGVECVTEECREFRTGH